MKYSQFLSSIVLGLILLFLSGCQTTTRVMVRAWAEDEYRTNVVDGEQPEPESYMLVRGSFDSGDYRDDSLLGDKDFLTIAHFLRDALSTQNYEMVGAGEPVDLAIVVHWGLTSIDTELNQRVIYFEGGRGIIDYQRITKESLYKNSLILGNTSEIFDGKGFITSRGDSIKRASSERYYFALVAYDARDWYNEKKKTVRWVTRFSADFVGTNYPDALPALTRVAAEYFGKNTQNIEHIRTDLGEVEIEFGEIEVVENEFGEMEVLSKDE